MSPDELKLTFGQVASSSLVGMIGAGIMWLLLKSYTLSYFSEKGKNLATKEDVGAITTTIEGIKAGYAKQLQELTHQNALLIEGFKTSLSSQQDFVRTANAAVVELTKKLAAGSHQISWLSWSATEPAPSLLETDFADYDKHMILVLSELVGLQASVAALDPEKYRVLSKFANRLYDLDVRVGRARDGHRTKDPERIAKAISDLQAIYEECAEFDNELLAAVTGLLRLPMAQS